ncbi:multidrug transporter [Streptomyces ruber]|uniref:Multidrug transporter n=3 Tax=Streptomyces TaxID=1883 RepID=A0A918EUX9_9ACTN|nr:multidrug transporter [Streptomyces ruber]
MGVSLAPASAACYGVVDFAGGLLSRRVHFAVAAFPGQAGSLLLALPAASLVPAEAVRSADVTWGALSGAGSAVAMLFLNRGLSRGAMSVVVPVSAVTGVALSVVRGAFFPGTGPPCRPGRASASPCPRCGWCPAAVPDGLIAGLGVAVQYTGLAQADPASGLWPVAAGRVVAVLVLLPSAGRHAAEFRQPVRTPGRAVLIGAGAALALILCLWSTRTQMLAVAVVVASLYPAVPTVLGLAALHERVTRARTAGLVSAAVAVVLLGPG